MNASQEFDFVEQLAEEFAERLRNGEKPTIQEYVDQYPSHAELIRDTFEAVAMMENLAPGSADSFGQESLTGQAIVGIKEVEQLGDFRIIGEVGRGGMGVVYEAEQVSLGRHVALKVLPSTALPEDKHVRRFEREAKSAARLHHTNIVPVFGVGEQDGMHYYVMQFIQGLPLDEVIDELKKIQAQPTGEITSSIPVERSGSIRQQSVAEVAQSLINGQFAETLISEGDSDEERLAPSRHLSGTNSPVSDSSAVRRAEAMNLTGSLSGSTLQLGKSGVHSSSQKPMTYWQSVANIGAQVADALQYAHDQEILHRDIKPSNLLLDLRGTTWVTDFGLAKATDQQDITHTGDILGTLRYMPPEAFDGISDARSDVYSLGLTLYELLAFQPAFNTHDRHQLVKLVTTETPPRLDKLNPNIPRDLVTIIHKAIDRDRTHRYQTAEELQLDLQRFLEDEPIRARRISLAEGCARWSRRNKGLATSLAAICGLLLIINIVGPLMYLKLDQQKKEIDKNFTELQESRETEKRLSEEKLQEVEGRRRAEKNELEARMEANEQRLIAANRLEAANRDLEGQIERQKRDIYAGAVLQVAHEADRGNLTRMREILLSFIPSSADETDLRGPEWYYWWNFLNQSQETGRLDLNAGEAVPEIAILPGGDLVAVGRNDQIDMYQRTEAGFQLSEQPSMSVPTKMAGLSFFRNPMTATGLVVDDIEASDPAFYSPERRYTAPSDSFRVWGSNATEPFLFEYPPGQLAHVSFMAVSPDGRRVAGLGVSSNLSDQPICRLLVWDVATQKLLVNLERPGEMNRIHFNHDGTLLVAYLCHSSLRVAPVQRDVVAVFQLTEQEGATKATQIGLARHHDDVDSVYFFPDRPEMLLSMLGWSNKSLTKEFLRWKIGENQPLERFGEETPPDLPFGEISPDGTLFAVSSPYLSTIRLIDTQTGKLSRTLYNIQGYKLSSLTFTPTGERLIACGEGPRSAAVLEWPLEKTDWYSLQSSPINLTRVDSNRFQSIRSPIYAISPDLSLLAYRDQQGLAVRTREGKSWPPIQGTGDLNPSSTSLMISPDNRLLVDYQSRHYVDRAPVQRLRFYEIDLETGVTLKGSLVELEGPGPISRNTVRIMFQSRPEMAFTSDGRLLVKRWGRMHAIDLETYEAREIEFPEGLWGRDLIQATQFTSPLAVNGRSGQAWIAALQPIANVDESSEGLSSSDISETAAGRIILSLFDAANGSTIDNLEVEFEGDALEEIQGIVAGPQGQHAAILWKKNSRVQICEFGSGKPVWELSGDGVVFSPDESLAAVTTNEENSARIRTVSVWDLTSRTEVSQLNLIGSGAEEIRFSPDSQRLLTLHGLQPSGGADVPAEMRFWDARSDHELWSIPIGHANHYYWDVAMDSKSEQSASLTTIIFAKQRVGKESSVAKLFDLTGMSEEEETEHIAGPLVRQLFEEHLLKQEVLAHLQSDVHPQARSKIEQLVNAYPDDDLDTVTDGCLNRIIARLTEPDSGKYQHWAEVLETWYHDDPRARLMTGIAAYYNGNTNRALEMLSLNEDSGSQIKASLTPQHELVRLAFRTLAHLRADQKRQAEKSARDLCRKIRVVFGDNCLAMSSYYFTVTGPSEMGELVDYVLREQLEFHECAVMGIDSTPQEMADNILSILDINSDGVLTAADSLPDWDVDQKQHWASLSGLDGNKDGKIDIDELTQLTTVLVTGTNFPGSATRYSTQRLLSAPLSSSAWRSRISYWRSLSQYERALADCEQGLRLTVPTNASHTSLLNLRGLIYLDRKDYPAAIDVFRQVTELDPDYSSAWNNLAVCLVNQGKYQESIPYYSKAIELNPNSTNINNRGNQYLRVGKLADALGDFTKLIGLEATADNYVKRGNVHLTLKNYDEAIADFDKALELDPKREALNEKLLLAYVQKGDKTQAARLLKIALDQTPETRKRLDRIEWIAELGIDFEQVLKDQHEYPLLLAAVAGKQSDSKDRQESFDRALQLAQENFANSPGNEVAAGVLAATKLVATEQPESWVVLNVDDMQSAGGATLTELEDRSILASGTLPDQEVYTITARPQQQDITTILLETLPHPSLPFGRSGRELRLGNFLISNFHLAIQNDEPGSEIRECSISRIASDFEGRYRAATSWVENMLGRGPANHWTAWPDVHIPHRVLFQLSEPLTFQSGDALTITIDCSDPKFPGRTLGRFRLSYSNSKNAFEQEQQRLTATQIKDPWQQLAAVFHVEDNNVELDQLLAKHPDAGLGIAYMNTASGSVAEVHSLLQSVIDSQQQADASPAQRAETLRACAALYISVGQWKEGADRYAESVKVDPEATSLDWMKPAALYAYADDLEGVRSHCRTMSDHFRDSRVPAEAERIVKSMLLMGDSFHTELDSQKFPIKEFLDSVDEKTMPARFRSWFLATRALLACRSEQFGDLAEAEDWLDQSKSDIELSTDYPGILQRSVLAVILAKQGRTDEARSHSNELQEVMRTKYGEMWNSDGSIDGRTILDNHRVVHDLLIPEILRREAERLLQATEVDPKNWTAQ